MARYLIKKGDLKARARGRTWRGSNQHIIKGVINDGYIERIVIGWLCDKAWLIIVKQSGRVQKRYQLNKYFKHWQKPTKAEVDMFEMVTGEKYLTHYLGIELT